jgi:hypothetical protein
MSTELIPDPLLEDVGRRLAALIAENLNTRVPRWVDAQGAADYLSFTLSKVRHLTTADAIPHHHHDGRVHYRTDELDTWLTNR